MYVWLLVVMLASGERQFARSPQPLPDEASCKAQLAEVESAVNDDDNVKAYAAKCFEFKKDDVKKNGKPT